MVDVGKSIVEAIFSALPKFETLRLDDVAAPKVGNGNGGDGFELMLMPFKLFFEVFTGRNGAALRRGPGGDLAFMRARMKILFGIFARHFGSNAADMHLA